MAISAANAVSPMPAAENAAMGGAALLAGNAPKSTFLDSLEAVLGAESIANGKTENTGGDLQTALFAQGNLAKLKSKLKTDVAANDTLAAGNAMIIPQQQPAAQQNDAAKLLENTDTGIDLPALRAAIGRNAKLAGQVHTMPANPSVGSQANADATSIGPETQTAAKTSAATAKTAIEDAMASTKPAATTNNAGKVTSASQAKLAAALVKTAQAPVLKGEAADGSTVPNAKIGRPAHTTPSKDTPSAVDQIAQTAANIAATAGAANTPDTAPTAAKAVALAEATVKSATATPSLTKVEAVAMNNAAQTAIHVPTSQAKVEAQALPVQFDAQSARQDNRNSNAQSDSGGKDQSQAGAAHIANDSAKPSATPAQNFAESQQQPAQAAAAPQAQTAHIADTGTSASASLAGATTQANTAQVAVNLHVAPQAQAAPTADQSTFAALGVTIAARSRDGQQQFDIKMDPAELGKVDVRISVDASGQAQAHLSVQHQHTLELLQNDRATLERNLRDAGLNLANNGLNFSLKGEQQPSTPTFNARNRALSVSAVQSTDSISTGSSTSIAPGDSRLDIRV